MNSATSRRRFILENTSVLPVPLVPEVRLHLAHEAIPLWQKTEEELAEIGLPPPFWAFAWAGGQALARYALDNRDVVDGQTVMDLASGSGLVAVAAKLAGAATVLAVDIDEFSEQAVLLNAHLNGVEIDFLRDNPLEHDPPHVDVILVGDLFYEKPLAAALLAWLLRAKERGTQILIGDPGRAYLPVHALRQCTRYQVEVTRELEDAEIKEAAVWALLAS